MRYIALAVDYDGTLAKDGKVDADVVDALKSLRQSGRKLLLVTGRELVHLKEVFPQYELFHAIVAENGGVIYEPHSDSTTLLCDGASSRLVEELKHRGVDELSVGLTIIATWTPHEHRALQAIKHLGLEHKIVFNKGAVMILPPGVNKGSGLEAALIRMGLSSHNVVGIGDAENDQAFLRTCECSFAVGNAIPSIKEAADYVTHKQRGQGVCEVIEGLLKDDLAGYSPSRHLMLLGTATAGAKPVYVDPYGSGVLISGISGGGKSKTTLGIVEKLMKQGYQFCLVDPEGDYESFGSAVVTGKSGRAPDVHEVMDILQAPERSAIVNLLDMRLEDRPDFFAQLLPRIQELRSTHGRPHWLIIDEAHHMFPLEWSKLNRLAPENLMPLLMITVHPSRIAREILSTVNLLIAVGDRVDETVRSFATQAGLPQPSMHIYQTDLEKGTGLVWCPKSNERPFEVRLEKSEMDKIRHRRKYAHGELPEHCSFYFRGPEGKLNLRAHNLQIFAQIADGVDDQTWMYHLRRKEYSDWFSKTIKDEELAVAAAQIEADDSLSPNESRRQMRRIIEERYTAAA